MPLRLVRDGTTVQFMKGRIAGLVVSAVLSLASVVLFFAPGLNYGLDFQGGIVMEVRTEQPADFGAMREGIEELGLGSVALQQFGSPTEVLIRLQQQPDEPSQQRAVAAVRAWLDQEVPGSRVVRTEAVGARVSGELFTAGMTALGIALLAMLLYIWFRFEWEYGVGAVVTLILDVTKAIGFLALTRIEFDLATVAAVLTIIGYSVNDKVVVYDRMRENLRKFKTMPLRQVIDLSINESLNRTIGTSCTTFLACLPLALIATGPVANFAWVMLFGIVVGTSSSIFIAAPILLFLGERRLRKTAEEVKAPA
ncbi:protein translocase subunit SecF [Elioraea sp.]|uniref:protein translocase subunit SecF n=1 Tax=Elioraea sp. TaxID=2185103 RepID=UPI0025B82721|nr:protein translocase subunit SecF [Elioraea sp.]